MTRDELREELAYVYRRMRQMEASQSATQQDIDNLTSELGAVAVELDKVASDLTSSISTVQAEIDQLASQGVNVTNLKAAADQLAPLAASLDTSAAKVGTLTPTPPPPAAPPAAPPVAEPPAEPPAAPAP